MTAMLVRHLERYERGGALEDVLALAGEPRSPQSLSDPMVWSTYGQFRKLLEAAATVLGGLERLGDVGAHVYDELTEHDYVEMLQALGSPGALFAEMGTVTATALPIVHAASEQVGPTEWLVRSRFTEGFEPFAAYCVYGAGTLASTPRIFGFAPGEVVEEACQTRGAAECVFRVRWDPMDEATRKVDLLETKVQLVEGRLEALQRTVTTLVSAEDVETVLAGIVASAARTIPAPAYVLAIEPLPTAATRVYAHGLDRIDADRLAAELLADGGGAGPDRVVVEVGSARARYGRLAALNPQGGSLLPQTTVLLEAFARLAAAALDSASAIEQARRDAATAQALLDLSASLAEVATTDETAAKIVNAVPDVVDCDQAVVFLSDPVTAATRAAAAHGYSPGEWAELASLVLGAPDASVAFRTNTSPDTLSNEALTAFRESTGTVGYAAVPIVWSGEPFGWIAVAVTDRPERLQVAGVPERLRGLASQAAAAIRNSRLLDQIRHEAMHDALTGLPNRTLIHDRITQMQARARRMRYPSAALFIDLDGFKTINDTLGHEVGDQLLATVAGRLVAAVRDGDTVGRLGGDEFVALVEGSALDAGPELVAERLLEVLRQPITLAGAGAPMRITASIGIAVGDRETVGELLRDADVALYEAKAAGKNRAVVFQPEMHTEIRHRLEMEMDLRGALERGEYFLMYQPVYDLSTGAMPAVEALLRWRHPSGAVVGPDTFIPILEDTRMIVEVGRWVLQQACRQTAVWHAHGHPLRVSVNVSAHQLELDSFVSDIATALAEAGLEPEALTVEITETAIMRDAQATARRLQAIKALGVRIAVDDFGTGQSSLGYLSQFPVDTLKIDRYFVNGLGTRTQAGALVQTLVQLGKALGLQIVAEGIETTAQAAELVAQHCDQGQGFLYSRPLDPDQLEQLIDRRAADAGLPAGVSGPGA